MHSAPVLRSFLEGGRYEYEIRQRLAVFVDRKHICHDCLIGKQVWPLSVCLQTTMSLHDMKGYHNNLSTALSSLSEMTQTQFIYI